MSIQEALETVGITKEEYECVLKIRGIHHRGNTAEVKRNIKEDSVVVYEVKKEKK